MENRLMELLPHLLESSGAARPLLAIAYAQRPLQVGSEQDAIAWVKKCVEKARGKDNSDKLWAIRLLEQALNDCSAESLPQIQLATSGILLSFLKPSEAPGIRAASCRTLAELHTAVAKIPAQSGGVKESSALLARFMPEMLKIAHARDTHPEVLTASLQTIVRCTRTHAQSMRPFANQVIGACCKLLAHGDDRVRDAASMCLALIPVAAPKDSGADAGGRSSAPLWQSLLKNLMEATSHLLWHIDGLRADGSSSAPPEKDAVPADLRDAAFLQRGDSAATHSGGSPSERFSKAVALADRFNGVTYAIQRMLIGGGYAGEGSVPSLGVIQIVERVLLFDEASLIGASFKHDSAVTAEMVALVLPRMQEDALELLIALLRRARVHTVSFRSVISNMLVKMLPPFGERTSRCEQRLVRVLRAASECMQQWGSAAEGVLFRKLAIWIKPQLASYAAAVSGEAASAQANVAHSRGQKRRRTAKSSMGMSSSSSEVMGDASESASAASDELLTACAEVIESLLRTLLAVYNASSSPPSASPSSCALRLAMLRAVWSAMVAPSPSQPIALAPALRILGLAKEDPCHQIRVFCATSLLTASALLQPRGPAVFRPNVASNPPMASIAASISNAAAVRASDQPRDQPRDASHGLRGDAMDMDERDVSRHKQQQQQQQQSESSASRRVDQVQGASAGRDALERGQEQVKRLKASHQGGQAQGSVGAREREDEGDVRMQQEQSESVRQQGASVRAQQQEHDSMRAQTCAAEGTRSQDATRAGVDGVNGTPNEKKDARGVSEGLQGNSEAGIDGKRPIKDAAAVRSTGNDRAEVGGGVTGDVGSSNAPITKTSASSGIGPNVSAGGTEISSTSDVDAVKGLGGKEGGEGDGAEESDEEVGGGGLVMCTPDGSDASDDDDQ